MSLLAPLFLLGLLAAVLPWWLHRLSASNPPRRDFGSTRFLETTQSTSSKKRRTRYWPLLALRFLFLALLSLIFAEPVIERLRTIGANDVRHIIVVDTSLSQNLDGRWQRTLDFANDVLDNASSSDEAIVISAADRFTQAQQQSNSIDAARDQLGTLSPGNTRLDYGRIASAVSAAISEDDISNHLHIITDAQATAMPERFTSLAVDKISSIDVYSTASDTDSNTSVTGKLEYSNGNSANVIAVVNNYGNAASKTLSIVSDGATLATHQLEIPENNSAVHRFTDLDISNANTQLELRITPDDALNTDNSWLVPLPVKERTEITLLTNDTQPAVANTYVAAALESNARFVARLTDLTRFSTADAGNLVIVPDAASVSNRIASQLRDYVESGGNVLIAVSNKPHSSETVSLLGIKPTGQSANEEPALQGVSIGAIDKSHQVASGIADNWRAASVIKYLPIDTNITDRTIIELSDGSPLLVEKRLGSGKMLLLTTALDTQWTDLPTESVFVAFIMKAVGFLGGDTTTALYRSTGDAISVAAGTQLIDPSGEPLRELSEISERASIQLGNAGIYELRSSAGTQSIAVNSDTRESDITTIDSETLAKWQQVATNTQTELTTEKISTTNQRSFWMWLLPLLLVLALLESIYSHRHLWIRRGT